MLIKLYSHCSKTIFCIAYLRICRENLPWLFAAGIYRGYFEYLGKSLFVYVNKFCFYGSKPFLYIGKTFWFVRLSLLIVLLFVIVLTVMGHRMKMIFFLFIFINFTPKKIQKNLKFWSRLQIPEISRKFPYLCQNYITLCGKMRFTVSILCAKKLCKVLTLSR